MSRRALTTILGVLAAASVTIGGGPAQAKTVPVTYDPSVFIGVGTFLVPDAPSPCLGLGIGFHFVNPGTEGCSNVTLESASLSTHDNNGGTANLSLASPSTLVTGMVLDPGGSVVHVVGMDTEQIPLQVDSCGGDLCGSTWAIQWESGLQPQEESAALAYAVEWDGNPLDGLTNQVLLFQTSCDGTCTTTQSAATNVVFAPEPDSLGLLLGALGAGWLVRRRKHAG